jgi:AraC family transcriptional regulator
MPPAMTTVAPRTLEDYGQRLDRVLAYLAEHLDAEVDLERLSQVACFSPFHFHRIYRAVQGETVAETVRRMRLHRAACELLDGARPIERVAARAGYGSQAAFTRAFRTAYGAPPAAYRTSARSVGPYAAEERTIPALCVAALRHVGDYAGIGPAFDRLNALAVSRGVVEASTRYFGIFHDDPAGTPVEALRSDACVTVPHDFVPEGDVRVSTIAGGRYGVVLHVGPYAELHRAYEWLYREWLLDGGRLPGDGPCVEEYLNDPRTTPAPELRTEVSLPITT